MYKDNIAELFSTGGRQGKLPCLAFEVYDFFDEKWRKLPDVPSKRVFAMYAATETHIVSLGGLMQPGNRGFSDACEVFDIETGKFMGVGWYLMINWQVDAGLLRQNIHELM